MGDLRDLLRAALEDNDEDKASMDAMKKMHEDTFGKARARAVFDAGVEWTMHEIFAYAMSALGPKNTEACEKATKLIAELRDTLIAGAVYDSPKMPNIDYFRSLNPCKEPE